MTKLRVLTTIQDYGLPAYSDPLDHRTYLEHADQCSGFFKCLYFLVKILVCLCPCNLLRCLRVFKNFPLILGRANVFQGPLKGAALRSLVKSVWTTKKPSGRGIQRPADVYRLLDAISLPVACPARRSLLVMRTLTKPSIDKVPRDLLFLDDQTAPKSYCLRMTEARSQRGYHRDASSNNPQTGRKQEGQDRAETQHPIGPERHGRLLKRQASDTPELSSSQMYTFFHTSGCSKATYAFSPERRHLGLYAPDMIDTPPGVCGRRDSNPLKIVSEILKESPH